MFSSDVYFFRFTVCADGKQKKEKKEWRRQLPCHAPLAGSVVLNRKSPKANRTCRTQWVQNDMRIYIGWTLRGEHTHALTHTHTHTHTHIHVHVHWVRKQKQVKNDTRKERHIPNFHTARHYFFNYEWIFWFERGETNYCCFFFTHWSQTICVGKKCR